MMTIIRSFISLILATASLMAVLKEGDTMLYYSPNVGQYAVHVLFAGPSGCMVSIHNAAWRTIEILEFAPGQMAQETPYYPQLSCGNGFVVAFSTSKAQIYQRFFPGVYNLFGRNYQPEMIEPNPYP